MQIVHPPDVSVGPGVSIDDFARSIGAHSVYDKDFQALGRKILADDRFQAGFDEIPFVAA
jgi:hypothetical protein